MSVNQRSLDEVVLAYLEAWSTPEAAVRRELLDISLAEDATYTDPAYEVRRTILREAEDRYRNELMNDEERMLLLDRIRRLRRTLGVLAR